MEIIFTKHAQKKFEFLKGLGWEFKPQDIKKALQNPLSTQSGYSSSKVVIANLSETHNLRVVYSEIRDIITIVTFYPVKKGRYDKK